MGSPGVRPTALQLVTKKYGFMGQNPQVHKVWRKVGRGSWKEVGRKGRSPYVASQVGSCEQKADLLSQSHALSWWGLGEQAKKPQGMGNPEGKGGWIFGPQLEDSRDCPQVWLVLPRELQSRRTSLKRSHFLRPLPASLL